MAPELDIIAANAIVGQKVERPYEKLVFLSLPIALIQGDFIVTRPLAKVATVRKPNPRLVGRCGDFDWRWSLRGAHIDTLTCLTRLAAYALSAAASFKA